MSSEDQNVCIILRGLPGCGKTSIAKLMTQDDSEIISMDMFWTRNGQQYKFDYNRIKEAAQWAKDQFLAALKEQRELIVVDNTHTRIWEMRFFQDQAKKAGYQVHVVHIERDIFDCFRDGRHHVRWDKMLEMADRWEPVNDRSMEGRLRRIEEEAAMRLRSDGWSDGD